MLCMTVHVGRGADLAGPVHCQVTAMNAITGPGKVGQMQTGVQFSIANPDDQAVSYLGPLVQ